MFTLKAALIGYILFYSFTAQSNCHEVSSLSHSLTDQEIVACLESNYEIKPIHITPLAGGADPTASVHKVETGSTTYFVKLRRVSDPERGLRINDAILDIRTCAGCGSPPIREL